jgi:hypothetical protein
MGEDWLLAAIARVECALESLRETLASVGEVLEPAQADRRAGVPLVAIADRLARDGGDPRSAIAGAFREYEQAVAALRAQVVHALVDEEGVTRSALAGRLSLSRQSVTRLYQAGEKLRQLRDQVEAKDP